jgi:hypothetical protein
MSVHRRPFLWITACCLLWPGVLHSQGVRGEVSLNWGWMQLQPLVVNSLEESSVPGSGTLRQLDDGTSVTCIQGDVCRWYERSGETRDITPFTQDLSFAGWTGVQGLSFGGHLRTRLGSEELWPRTEQKLDLMSGYLKYSKSAFQITAGRLYRRSGLGYYNFDGASFLLRSLDWVWVDAYGGWSLAPGVNAPRNGELYREADLLATNRRGLLFGGEIGFRGGKIVSGSATYQREIRTDRAALYTERGAVSVRALVSGWVIDGSASYDFAFDEINDARLRVTAPSVEGIRLSGQARRYAPFFEYWTIWSAFSPVGFAEGQLSATWSSRDLPLLVELGGAYREYEEADAGPATTTVKDNGWRGFGRVYWNPGKWYVDGRYRVERGYGGSRYGGDLILGHRFDRSTYVALRGTSTEMLSEFRTGERYVTGGGVEGAYNIGKANLTVDGSVGLFHYEDKNRPRAENWTEGRVMLGLRWRFNAGGAR